MPSAEAANVLRMNSELRDAWLADPAYDNNDFRQIFEDWLAQFEIPEGTQYESVSANGVPCIWADAPGVASDRVIVHFHSGGYLLGSAHGYRSFGGFLSAATGCRVLLPDYRLAPDHSHPAAIEDAIGVYRWLLGEGFDPAKIVICGDSAGGGLALIALQQIRDAKLPLPAAGISISPLADFAHSGESRKTNEHRDPLVTMDLLLSMGVTYCGDLDRRDPLVSPLYGNWSGLPPIMVLAGEIEMLRDDGKQCAQAAAAAGVDAIYVEGEGMAHIWPIYADRLPEARDTLRDIGAFVERHMAEG